MTDSKSDWLPNPVRSCLLSVLQWTIMKAPLLLGNDIRKIDNVTLSVLKNKDALAISQDASGIQARRVHVTPLNDSSPQAAFGSAAAVARPCDASVPTQTWALHQRDTLLTTTDGSGVEWCADDHS